MVKLAVLLLKVAEKLKDAYWSDAGDEAELDELIEEIRKYIYDARFDAIASSNECQRALDMGL